MTTDFGTYGTVVHENGSLLTVDVASYGLGGIMEISFVNGDSGNDITVVTNIEFQNVNGGNIISQVTDPPPLA